MLAVSVYLAEDEGFSHVPKQSTLVAGRQLLQAFRDSMLSHIVMFLFSSGYTHVAILGMIA